MYFFYCTSGKGRLSGGQEGDRMGMNLQQEDDFSASFLNIFVHIMLGFYSSVRAEKGRYDLKRAAGRFNQGCVDFMG